MEAKGVDKAILVGNSMGGLISLNCARRHPEIVDKLVLVDSAGYPNKMPITLKLIKTVNKGLVNSVQSRWMYEANLKDVYYDKKKVTEDMVDRYYAPFTLENGMTGGRYLLRTRFHDDADTVSKWMSKINHQALIIWGENDTWIELGMGQRMDKDLPNSTLVVIPECGHVPEEEKPEETVKAILEWQKI